MAEGQRRIGWETGVIDEWLALEDGRRGIRRAQFAVAGVRPLSLPTYFEEALGIPSAISPRSPCSTIQGIVGVAAAFRRRSKAPPVFSAPTPRACQRSPAWRLPFARGRGLGGASQDANVSAAAVLVDVGLALSALTLRASRRPGRCARHAGLVFGHRTRAPRSWTIAVPLSGWAARGDGVSWSAVFGVIAVLYVVGAALWWVGCHSQCRRTRL